MDKASGGVGGEADPREPLPLDPGSSGLCTGPSSPRIGARDGGSPGRDPQIQDRSLGGSVVTRDTGESWARPLGLVDNPPGEADRTDGVEIALTSDSQMNRSDGETGPDSRTSFSGQSASGG